MSKQRTREEIEKEVARSGPSQKFILEVLLDIRDLLAGKKKEKND